MNEETVQEHGKLRTFSLFKSYIYREPHLDLVPDITKRKSLTKFRISAYKLEVESGWYKRQPISERICKFCKQNKVEDDVHFLCNCSAYDLERRTFLTLLLIKFHILVNLMNQRN